MGWMCSLVGLSECLCALARSSWRASADSLCFVAAVSAVCPSGTNQQLTQNWHGQEQQQQQQQQQRQQRQQHQQQQQQQQQPTRTTTTTTATTTTTTPPPPPPSRTS